MSDLLTIAGNTYSSRLLIGTGKYKDFDETRDAIETSGAVFLPAVQARLTLIVWHPAFGLLLAAQAIQRRRSRGVGLARHAPGQEGFAAGFDGFLHGGGHQYRLLGMGHG